MEITGASSCEPDEWVKVLNIWNTYPILQSSSGPFNQEHGPMLRLHNGPPQRVSQTWLEVASYCIQEVFWCQGMPLEWAVGLPWPQKASLAWLEVAGVNLKTLRGWCNVWSAHLIPQVRVPVVLPCWPPADFMTCKFFNVHGRAWDQSPTDTESHCTFKMGTSNFGVYTSFFLGGGVSPPLSQP